MWQQCEIMLWQYKICIKRRRISCDSSATSCCGRIYVIQRGTNHLQLEVYRKPTQTDTTIHFSSDNPLNQKLAAYSFYTDRMLILPITRQAQNQEWSIICTIARNNDFPLQLIESLRNRIIKKLAKHNQTMNSDNRTWVTFTYFSPLA
jgi:hypothetical protein